MLYQGRIQGGHRGQMTPLPICAYSKTSTSKLIGAINLLYYKAQEPARLCLGIHIKTIH